MDTCLASYSVSGDAVLNGNHLRQFTKDITCGSRANSEPSDGTMMRPQLLSWIPSRVHPAPLSAPFPVTSDRNKACPPDEYSRSRYPSATIQRGSFSHRRYTYKPLVDLSQFNFAEDLNAVCRVIVKKP